MANYTVEGESVFRFHHQQLGNEIARICGEAVGEAVLLPLDTIVSISLHIIIKRRLSFQKLVNEDTQGPVVNKRRIRGTGKHFRREIIRCSTVSSSAICWIVDRPAKIRQFQNFTLKAFGISVLLILYENIFWFKISMHHVLRMHII